MADPKPGWDPRARWSLSMPCAYQTKRYYSACCHCATCEICIISTSADYEYAGQAIKPWNTGLITMLNRIVCRGMGQIWPIFVVPHRNPKAGCFCLWLGWSFYFKTSGHEFKLYIYLSKIISITEVNVKIVKMVSVMKGICMHIIMGVASHSGQWHFPRLHMRWLCHERISTLHFPYHCCNQ